MYLENQSTHWMNIFSNDTTWSSVLKKKGLCNSHDEITRSKHPSGTSTYQPSSLPVKNPEKTGTVHNHSVAVKPSGIDIVISPYKRRTSKGRLPKRPQSWTTLSLYCYLRRAPCAFCSTHCWRLEQSSPVPNCR